MKAFLGKSDAPFVWGRLCSGWCSESVRIKSSAAYCFSLIERFQGVLHLIAAPSTSPEFSNKNPEGGMKSTLDEVLCRGSAIRHHDGKWTVDGRQCKLATPKLNFCCIPKDVKQVTALLFTQIRPDSGRAVREPDLLNYQPENEDKVKFSYRGNIDIQ